MLRLIRDDKLRKQMGVAARERVVNSFTWDLSARGYEELYKEVLEKKK
jgi:glycosyltransferase involved in cell wall biosynthesis